MIKGGKILTENSSEDDEEIFADDEEIFADDEEIFADDEEIFADDEKIIPDMVRVYSENNSALLQIAKTMLSVQGIIFRSNGEYAGSMVSRIPYVLTIKVFEKDEKAARLIINKLSSAEPYTATNETDRKINAFIGKWVLIIIIVSFLFMLAAFFIFNNK